jgi:hypothetical protein
MRGLRSAHGLAPLFKRHVAGRRDRRAGPIMQLVRVVQEPLGKPPIGAQLGRASLRHVREGARALGLERQPRLVRCLEEDRAVVDKGEENAVEVTPTPPNMRRPLIVPIRPSASFRISRSSSFADMNVLARASLQPTGANPCGVAGSRLTLSPQPHALFWFGLLNTNCEESLSVL